MLLLMVSLCNFFISLFGYSHHFFVSFRVMYFTCVKIMPVYSTACVDNIIDTDISHFTHKHKHMYHMHHTHHTHTTIRGQYKVEPTTASKKKKVFVQMLNIYRLGLIMWVIIHIIPLLCRSKLVRTYPSERRKIGSIFPCT